MTVSGNVSQRRIYGFDGKALVDIDTHDHTLPSAHPTGLTNIFLIIIRKIHMGNQNHLLIKNLLITMI